MNVAAREFVFLFLKMRDITTCLHADKDGPREKQKPDEARRRLDWSLEFCAPSTLSQEQG